MQDSLASNGTGSGLLGKILLPKYADAGANTSFQPVTRRLGGDQGSEAATEVRDNRSAIKQQFRINASRHHQTVATQQYSLRFLDDATSTDSSAISGVHPPNQLGDGEARYAGFFPTTKPQLSPRPSSPPSLPRQQSMLVASALSVAGTSVVPETGAVDFDMKQPTGTERAQEKENQRRIYYWEDGVKTIPSQKNNLALNAANLHLVERERRRQTPSSPTSDSSSAASPRPNRSTSLLKDEDGGSDVMSTASEMGTVIEMGSNAARMAEIDAMAALIEASPNVDTLTPRPESFPLAPSRTPLCRTVEEAVASLSLPELDSAPNQAIVLAPHTKANPSSTRSSFQQELKNQPVPSPPNPTPAEMISSALRRIGTGLNKTKASLSAPPTPRTPGVPPPPRVEDLLKSSLNSYHHDSRGNVHTDLPLSLALRSPGSSARLSLRRLSHQRHDEETRPDLAPRFSPTRSSKVIQTSSSFDSVFSTNYRTKTVKTLPSSIPSLSSREAVEQLKLNPLSPFHLAQKCFSYDSTLDEPLDTDSVSSSHIFNLESSYPMHRHHQHQRKIKESISWDVGGTSGAFRAQPHRSYRIGALKPTTTQIEHNAQRLRIYSDFSPRRAESNLEGNQESNPNVNSNHNSVLKLQTPDRYIVDVEREDALDILACLVERGVSVWNEEPTNLSCHDSTDSTSQAIESVIDDMLQELRKTPAHADDSNSKKVIALEALQKSHAYATEMKRAALSASTWLRSIGRGIPVSDQRKPLDYESFVANTQEASEVGQASGEDASSDKLSDTNVSFSAAIADTKMEMLTLKARLHRAENELKEKTIMNQKLDEELCKCRAEIGRLRTATRNSFDNTQAHSIIDDEVEDSITDSTVATCPAIKGGVMYAVSTPEDTGGDSNENKLFDESFQGNNSLFQDVSMHEQTDIARESDKVDIRVLKTALEQANDTIRFLQEKLRKEVSEHERNEPPTIAVPEIGTSDPKSIETQGPETKSSEASDEHRTINVRMLDGENFVTEWNELSSPLPPPPDHGLRSPIVNAVLTQWTEDPNLHHSLLSWMERVMTGDNLENTVPPLTISSLDHQVRDGFIMHVLPLLLRRADIHVAVQMRVHRRTTYDLAVSVNQKRLSAEGRFNESRSPSLLDQHSNDEWGAKVDKSSFPNNNGTHGASTIALENVLSRNSQPEDMEYSHFGIPNAASEDMEDNQQSTFIGALGGAIGGLLSRGKYSAVQSPSRTHSGPLQSMPGFQVPHIRGVHDVAPLSALSNRMAELDYQPYHRVVSAPPGRIGVTFVEYRGHAMVADMAPDSPLSSWVFPSDILIAVDEIPVSGMRVRDIIKILTNRRDRQRALRVISSHAMNEFTLNQSTVGDEPP